MKEIGCVGHIDLTRMKNFSLQKAQTAILAYFQKRKGEVKLLCGFADGADTLFAETAMQAGIPVVAVLPCAVEEFAKEHADQEKFYRLLEGACSVLIKENATHKYLGNASYILERCEEICVLWDGVELPLNVGEREVNRGGTYDFIRLAKAQNKKLHFF